MGVVGLSPTGRINIVEPQYQDMRAVRLAELVGFNMVELAEVDYASIEERILSTESGHFSDIQDYGVPQINMEIKEMTNYIGQSLLAATHAIFGMLSGRDAFPERKPRRSKAYFAQRTPMDKGPVTGTKKQLGKRGRRRLAAKGKC